MVKAMDPCTLDSGSVAAKTNMNHWWHEEGLRPTAKIALNCSGRKVGMSKPSNRGEHSVKMSFLTEASFTFNYTVNNSWRGYVFDVVMYRRCRFCFSISLCVSQQDFYMKVISRLQCNWAYQSDKLINFWWWSSLRYKFQVHFSHHCVWH